MNDLKQKAIKDLMNRADWWRWFAKRPPNMRILTEEECHYFAREAESVATALARGKLDRQETDTDATGAS